MKTPRFFSILSIAMLSSVCFAQTVSNVRFEQVDNKVKITYSLDKQADISVCVSEDGGKTWSSPLQQVSGDVGIQVQPGSKTLWWNMLSEYEQLTGTNICFKVATGCGDLTFTVNGETFTMIYVQGGTFTMGSTEFPVEEWTPAHEVTLDSYYIGKCEVSQGLWKAVVGSNPAFFQNLHEDANILPIERVSWDDCMQFVYKLNSLLSAQLGGKQFRLPTEAQWEYAARGGNKSQGFLFAGSDTVYIAGWSDCSSSNVTWPVGMWHPNELGIHDMSGNVWEWCSDWMGDYPHGAQTNPFGPNSGEKRVIRGGAFNTPSNACLVMCRGHANQTERDYSLGMRLVLY